MRLFLISDNSDTVTGMRLAGVEGVVIKDKNEFQPAVDKALADGNIGILLVTEGLSGGHSQIIDKIKLSETTPLVVEIPDRFGSKRGSDFISAYVREAIGVKL